MQSNPLVSIVVITYNSSKYVLETLESAKSQTYQNIELIITDDCSPDNTVEICKEWLAENGDRFVRTELIEAEKNTGISANCNRGYSAAKGEWIKCIAGDDILLDNCITDNVEHVLAHPEIDIQFSNVDCICNDKGYINYFKQVFRVDFYNLSAKKQLERSILIGYCVPSATLFLKQDLYRVFKFDERIPMIEDYPYWVMLLSKGHRFYHLNKTTAQYRVQGQGISNSTPSDRFKKSRVKIYWYYTLPYHLRINPYMAIKIFLRRFLIDRDIFI